MTKQDQLYILKLKSSRLYEGKYDIKVNINQARKYKELIQLGDNQVLKTIRKITNKDVDFEYIHELKKEKNKLTFANTDENKKRIQEIQNELDKLLFMNECIFVTIDKIKEYDRISKSGFKVNGVLFRRLSCSSSQGRNNTVLFVDDKINNKLKEILMNGIDKNIEVVPNKLNAYFGLNSSSIYEVDVPRVCVIKDKEIFMKKNVDFIDDNDNINSCEKEVALNLWDGQGLISVNMSKHWARKNLKIYDYTPSYYIVRSSWIKGSLFTFDFHKFAKEVAETEFIYDIYGKKHNITEIDVILTASQFKMYKSYSSFDEYLKKCNENNIVWGVTRVAPKKLDDYTTTNYQFIQTLNLNDEDIKLLLEPTIKWIDGVMNNNPLYTILFMNGSFNDIEIAKESLLKSNNPYLKAIMYNPNMINDTYIKKKIKDLIKKKIKEAMIAKILIRGNFSAMCSDPYGLCEHAFGIDVRGLLKEGEHYSYYWNKKGINIVDAMRSPLTWKSEHNLLNLKNEESHKKWYKHLKTCVIYNVWGTDCMRHADGDFDGDLVCTTDNEFFIKGTDMSLLPITYNKNVAKKIIIDSEDVLIDADKQSFNSRIGQITNVSTKLYANIPIFNENSMEYNEIIRRLKLLRKEQGNEIDRAKGIETKPFNSEWTIFNKINDDDSEEEIKRKKFNNIILADKKPYFMTYLYNSCKQEYIKHTQNCDVFSQVKFGITMKELLDKKNKNVDELKHVEYYYKFMPVNMSQCIVNKICCMIEKYNEEKFKSYKNKNDFDTIKLMMDKNVDWDEKNYNRVKKIYFEYNKIKRKDLELNDFEIDVLENNNDKNEDYNIYNNINEIYERKLLEISSNTKELANYAVMLCYIENNPLNKDFVWKLCQNGVLENIKNNSGDKLYIPILDNKFGDIEYLGQKYRLEDITDV